MGTGLGLLVCVKPAIDRRRPPPVPCLEGRAYVTRELGGNQGPHRGTGYATSEPEGLFDRTLPDAIPSRPFRGVLHVAIPRVRYMARITALARTLEPKIRREASPQVRALPVRKSVLAVCHGAPFVRSHEPLSAEHAHGIFEDPCSGLECRNEGEGGTYELEGGSGALFGLALGSPTLRDCQDGKVLAWWRGPYEIEWPIRFERLRAEIVNVRHDCGLEPWVYVVLSQIG